MPDLMDPNYASEYPHQPYNGNPHMHPGELTLIRTIGQGRWQHPFHEHANHVRILARDGNLILSSNPTPVTFGSGLAGDPGVTAPGLAGTLMFNTDTTPGESFDGIFYFTGRGLNWDPYGHHPAGTGNGISQLPVAAISESGTTVTVSVNESQVPTVGGQIVVSGVTPAGYNGSYTITGTGAGASASIASVKETGTTVTVTASAALPAGFKAGAYVTVAGVPTSSAYNGAFKILAVPTTTTFTYTAPSGGLATGTNLAATASASLNVATLTYTAAAGLGTATNLTSALATVSLGTNSPPNDPLASLPCTPDVNGYNSQGTDNLAYQRVNFMEWCQDHNKPVQVAPFGDVAVGGPATLPDPNVFTNGQWYGGSPYLGPDATLRGSHAACDVNASANCTDLLPSNTQANPANERGWAFMWHSHNEREITTNNVFPGGMLMMMLVDSREFAIDESN
jgi:hypothetical protein